MPFYDLKCRNCGIEFNAKATIEMRENNRILCPECGETNMEAVFKTLNYSIKKNSQDSMACPNAHICGCNCHHG